MVWYQVRDLAAARDWYSGKLGFTETYYDEPGGWAKLERGATQIGLAQGEPAEGNVASIDVDDLKAEAERLRGDGVEVGTVLELHEEIRLLDVYDPDGNRVQLVQELQA